MKVIKSYITVDDVLDRLTDEDLAQVKCAYFSKVKYDDEEIEFTMVVDNEDGTDEECDIAECWYDPEDALVDEYMDYLMNNRLFEIEEKDNG